MRNIIYHYISVLLVILFVSFIVIFTGCTKNSNSDIGPERNLKLSDTDKTLAEKGKDIFNRKCTICHRMNEKLVGPPLNGVTKNRKPEWIMNMILIPDTMLKEDESAKKLLEDYKSPMPNQFLSEEEARALLEYFRANDENK